jgi:hypothetical protein
MVKILDACGAGAERDSGGVGCLVPTDMDCKANVISSDVDDGRRQGQEYTESTPISASNFNFGSIASIGVGFIGGLRGEC